MIQRLWKALTTWLMLADAFEASRLSRTLSIRPRWELLREKFRSTKSESLRRLGPGFYVRNNRSDTSVLISMPFEYGIVEWNFQGHALTIVDAGANIGAFAIYLSCFTRIDRYVGIEVAPSNFAVLEKNLQRLGPQFTAVRCALADAPKEMSFDLAGNPSRFAKTDAGLTQRALPLDEIPAVADLRPIDILKVDVEGSEEEVLRGARDVLNRTRCVVMEIHHAQIGAEAAARVMDIMAENFVHITYQQSVDLHQTNGLFWRRDSLSLVRS